MGKLEHPLVESIHHVAVIVSDVNSATAFYQKVFGLPQIERLTARTSANGGAWFKVGALELHLQERWDESARSEQHFALLTKHFDEIVARVSAAGGRVEDAKLINGMRKRGFVYDLDGNRIELLQP